MNSWRCGLWGYEARERYLSCMLIFRIASQPVLDPFLHDPQQLLKRRRKTIQRLARQKNKPKRSVESANGRSRNRTGRRRLRLRLRPNARGRTRKLGKERRSKRRRGHENGNGRRSGRGRRRQHRRRRGRERWRRWRGREGPRERYPRSKSIFTDALFVFRKSKKDDSARRSTDNSAYRQTYLSRC